MEIETEKKGTILIVLLLEERFDAVLAPEFIATMKEWIAEGNIQVVLDLSKVDFIDSTALGVIVQSLKRIKQAGEGGTGELALCGVNDKVMSLLKLTRMDRVFPIFLNSIEAERVLAES